MGLWVRVRDNLSPIPWDSLHGKLARRKERAAQGTHPPPAPSCELTSSFGTLCGHVRHTQPLCAPPPPSLDVVPTGKRPTQ